MNCKICGTEEISTIDTKIRRIESDEIKVYECKNCGVHFLYPYFEDLAIEEYYNGKYRKEYSNKNYYDEEVNRKFFNRALPEAKKRYERIKHYLSYKDEVLEIGCASGYFLDTIRESVSKVFGVELDEINRNYCKKIDIDTCKDIKLIDKQFDKIFMFHVLEHIKDPIMYLKELKKYLKKDGMLFIEVPNLEDPLLSIYNIQEYRDFYYQIAHLWYFNNRSLEFILNKCGFDFDFINIQRYDLTNHLNWLKNKTPGGNKEYREIFNSDLIESYNDNLVKLNKTDTLFAICSCK